MVLYKHAFKPVPLFSNLTDRKLSLLAVTGRRQKFPSKKMMLQERDSGDALLVICRTRPYLLYLMRKRRFRPAFIHNVNYNKAENYMKKIRATQYFESPNP